MYAILGLCEGRLGDYSSIGEGSGSLALNKEVLAT